MDKIAIIFGVIAELVAKEVCGPRGPVQAAIVVAASVLGAVAGNLLGRSLGNPWGIAPVELECLGAALCAVVSSKIIPDKRN